MIGVRKQLAESDASDAADTQLILLESAGDRSNSSGSNGSGSNGSSGSSSGNSDTSIIPTTVYILEHSHSDTYYHFLVEALPRLEHLWTLISTDSTVKVFQASPFAPSAFALLGLGPDRACVDRHLIYPRVFLPPPRTDPRDEPSTARLKRMAGRLIDAAGLRDAAPESTPTWMVVSRAGAKSREIKNHARLMAGLRRAFPGVVFKEFGVDEASSDGSRRVAADSSGAVAGADETGLHTGGRRAEGMGGVERSLRAFRPCWGVIAPHGAGLSNIIFLARKNASVVEIVGEGQTGKVYEALGGQFGHRHMYVTAPHVAWQGHHMVVDVPAVLKAVAPLFEGVVGSSR